MKNLEHSTLSMNEFIGHVEKMGLDANRLVILDVSGNMTGRRVTVHRVSLDAIRNDSNTRNRVSQALKEGLFGGASISSQGFNSLKFSAETVEKLKNAKVHPTFSQKAGIQVKELPKSLQPGSLDLDLDELDLEGIDDKLFHLLQEVIVEAHPNFRGTAKHSPTKKHVAPEQKIATPSTLYVTSEIGLGSQHRGTKRKTRDRGDEIYRQELENSAKKGHQDAVKQIEAEKEEFKQHKIHKKVMEGEITASNHKADDATHAHKKKRLE